MAAIQPDGENSRTAEGKRTAALAQTSALDEVARKEAMEVFQTVMSAERRSLLELMKQTNLLSLAGWLLKSSVAEERARSGR